jgi:hypothetical protein
MKSLIPLETVDLQTVMGGEDKTASVCNFLTSKTLAELITKAKRVDPGGAAQNIAQAHVSCGLPLPSAEQIEEARKVDQLLRTSD